MKTFLPLYLCVPALLATAISAQAAPQHHHRPVPTHRLPDRDLHVWTNGRWVNTIHNHKRGWWWVTANNWYFYAAPVYPYPDPYRPSVVVIEKQVTQVETPAPADLAPVQDGKSWYYCANPDGYYPYVQGCSVAWKKVPAAPNGGQIADDVPPPPPPAPKYWYHCANPEGYYPYVAACNGSWEKVTPE